MSESGNSNTSRRSFLKASAATSAVLASSLSIARSANAGEQNEIRIALIGCGGRGTGATSQALSTKGPVKLVALADAFADNIENSLGNLKGVTQDQTRIDVPKHHRYVGFDAYKQIMQRDDIDLVILATPPGFRPIHYAAAVAAGKHVFMEKPVAVDVPGIHSVLETTKIAKEKNLKIGVGLQRHHDPHYIETIKRIQDGAIGDIISTRSYWMQGAAQVRTRAGLEEKYGRKLSEMEYQMRNWYYFAWLGGDHIVEQHIHNIDVCNWAMNDYPMACQSVAGRQVRTGKDYGHIYDHHAVEFVYGKRWDIGVRQTSMSRQIQGALNDVGEHIHGTKGYCSVSGFYMKDYNGKKIWKIRKQRGVNAYQIEHDDLFDAVRNNKAYNEAENAANSTLSGIMGRLASYSGAKITLKAANKSQISLAPTKYDFNAVPPILPNDDGFYPVAMPGTANVL